MSKKRTVELIAKLKDKMSPGLRNLAKMSAGAAAAIVAVGVAALAAAKKLSDYGAKIYDIASATGVGIDSIQSLGYVFEQTGGSMDSMSGSIRGLNTFMRTAATGSAEYMNVLSDLGLEYDDLRAMEPEQAFLAITDAIGNLDTAMEKNIAATTVFGGRYAQQITGALDQTSGSLRSMAGAFRESGNAMTGEQINKLKAYSDHLTDFDFATKKLTADVLEDFLPMLTDLANMFIDGVNGAKDIADAFGGLGEVVKSLTILIGTFTAVKIIDMAVNGQLTLSTGVLAAAKLKLAGAAMTAKAALSGPAGLAAAAVFTGYQLIQLKKAMDDATASAEANDEAMALAADANVAVGDILMSVQIAVRDGAEMSAESVAVLTNRIEAMGASEEVTANAVRFLAAQIEGSTEAATFAINTTQNLTRKTDDLTLAMLDEAIAAVEVEMAHKRLNAELENGPTAIAGELARSIAEAERLRQLMLDIKAGNDPNEGRTDLPGFAPENFDTAREQLTALEQFRINLEMAANQEATTAHEDMVNNMFDTRSSMIENLANQEQIANQETADARQTALEKAEASMKSFASSAIGAAMEGKEAWSAFWDNMASRIIQTLAIDGLMAFLSFASGGGMGFLGGVAGFLGFKGGGTVPHHSAAGGMTVPGSTSMYGDRTPIMAEAGEVVLSKNQAQDLQGGVVTNHFSLSFPAMISTASSAQITQAIPTIKKILQKGNLL